MRLIDADALMKKLNGIWDCNDMTFAPVDGCCIDADCKSCRWRETIEYVKRLVQNQTTASPWHRVEDGLPDDEVPVLAMLHNTYGRNVVLKLCHIGHHKRTTEEYGWQEYEGETEYDEENDCFWIPEGWWESNYHEDNLNWEINETDGAITHWMPLPEPPKEGE